MMELDYDEYDPEEPQDAEEWQAGQCDNCGMQPSDVLTALVVCACSIGQGSEHSDCQCPWGES